MFTHDYFLRAIIAAPSDDLPRLAYADFLEESGEPERAEYIRVQCDLDALNKRYPDRNPLRMNYSVNDEIGWYRLKKREIELEFGDEKIQGWGGNYYRWFVEPYLEFFSIDSVIPAVVRRGFIDEIHCTLAQFFGGLCEACGGHGVDYSYQGHIEDLPQCPTCQGKRHFTALGPQIFRDHPVTLVVITDREPYKWPSHHFWWLPDDGFIDVHYQKSIIPKAICPLGRSLAREAAIDALSDACCRWARAEADKMEAV